MQSNIYTASIHGYFLRFMCALAFCLTALTAQASTLKDAAIESYIASAKEVYTVLGFFEKEPEDEDVIDNSADDDNWPVNMESEFNGSASALVKEMRKHPPTFQKVEAIVKRHGFNDLEEWADIGDRVDLAYWAISLEGQSFGIDPAAMESYMKSLGEIGGMPAANMESLRGIMESSLKMNEAIRNVPKEDIEAVRPYVDQIKNITGGGVNAP
ncbi:hypothetical protein OQJ62_03780 [Microbulbifer thermotolerans]|uniref:hypothetical protein n=1 Tax=Microbulbifer thermotolerans TaxID=252514 RepID=UPI0022494CF5|nr:hypothetical protein [Microbulbifer thermotolerans]MCX2794040.1 hypothetical protein [Microbulbifer thermotolerans]